MNNGGCITTFGVLWPRSGVTRVKQLMRMLGTGGYILSRSLGFIERLNWIGNDNSEPEHYRNERER